VKAAGEGKEEITRYSFVEPAVDTNRYDDETREGYQPHEFLKGFSLIDANT
jgi:hypothetical protein